MGAGKFKIVIIGAGAISQAAHVPAVLASPVAKLVGVVDPDVDRARALCRSFGVEAAVAADVGQLGVEFDGAIVAAPNDLHAPITLSLVQKGIPVLVEKPVATSVDAARELTRAADEKGVVVAVGYHTRFSGACRMLKHAIDSERFGRVLRFAHQDGSRGGWSPLSGYNLDTKRAGGGVLVTTGTHFLDRLIWFWGSPAKVSFRDNASGGPESHCIAHFVFRNGDRDIAGLAIFSKVVALPEMTVVETTEGLLLMPSDAGETITFRPNGDRLLEYEVRFARSGHDPRKLYQRELEDFIDACRSGRKPCVDAGMATASLELLSRLYEARQPLHGSEMKEYSGD
jgi:predicted dehydrogenase